MNGFCNIFYASAFLVQEVHLVEHHPLEKERKNQQLNSDWSDFDIPCLSLPCSTGVILKYIFRYSYSSLIISWEILTHCKQRKHQQGLYHENLVTKAKGLYAIKKSISSAIQIKISM